MAKKVIVGGRIESKEVGGIVTGAAEILDDSKGKKQSVINQETDAELLRLDQSKQDNLTFDNVPTEGSNNPVKSAGVYAADKALSDAIEAIMLLIPSAASALNKLVDTAMMNSSISTATATFKGTYNVVTDLELAIDATHEQIAAKLGEIINTADNNDYAFVQIPVSAESTDIRRTERYKFNGTAWAYEYDLNTSGFTAAQWAAINSGITLALVAKLSGLPTSSELMALLGQKQDTLTFDNVPTAGSNNPVKSGGVYSAINDEKAAREQLAQTVTGIDGRVGDVEEVIPAGAAANNKLVANSSMEAYVTSIIDAITASFTIATDDGHINLTLTQTNGRVASLTLTSSDIASAQALTALTGRVSTAEGNITSITGRISTAESDIAALQALYNALQQSAPQVIEPTDTWPVANPSGTVIYRVIDRVNTPPQYYSDYMWNGTSFVLMATYNNAIDPRPKKASQNLVTSGGVFDNMGALDVSELNATENPHTLAQYVDLSAALAAVPTDYQKGGMSIKFVQSSDNKYIQARLMTNAFSTNVSDWQGVDDEPTAGSDNLVKSSGVAKFREMDFAIESGLAMFSKTEARMVKYADGTLDADGRYDIYSLKLSGTNYTEIVVKAATIYKIYAAIAFYSTDTISADSYMGGVLMEVDVVAPGNEKVGKYSANIPTGAKLVVVTNCNSGSLPIPEAAFLINASTLDSEIEDNRKQIELKENLVNTKSISTISYQHSFVYTEGGFLFDGGNQNFDIYSIRCKGGEHIHAKVGMNNTPSIATVSMFKSPYWDAGRFGMFYLSDKTIANNKKGIIELDIDVPIGCHLVLISNNNTAISTPEINVFKRYVEDVETTQLILSPLKNVFNKNTIVFDKKIYISGTTWRIDGEPGAAIAVVPLLGWGGDYIVIDGLGDTAYSKSAIFLDENKTPNYDGASYSIDARLSAPKVIALTRPYWNNNKYIVIQLWRGPGDWGNQNSANGYVWSQDEISQGYPNWIDNIVINFVNAPNVVPTLSTSDKEHCAGESYDKAKTELFAKVSTELLANSYKPSQKFNFLLATDSHIDYNYPSKRNVEDMVEFANLNNIRQNLDCVIHNGDVATPGYVQDAWGKIDEGYDEYYNIIDNIKVPFIQVSGNHDRHQEHNVPVGHAYTIAKCVSLLKEHSIHSSDTLYDYQDFVDKKIRIIKLDAFDYPLEDDGTANNYVKYPLDEYDCLVSQSQMSWFVNTLLSTPNDYNIIVIGHIYAEKTILINPITQILSALINKTSGTASFDYSDIQKVLPYGSFSVSYDFSSANNVKIVGLFGGHSHKDTYINSNGINVIINGCQLLEDTTYGNTEIIHRGAYTKYQNNFSAITVDMINNKIKIVRYGYGWPKGIPYNGITEFDY